jgi:hypothetical protein
MATKPARLSPRMTCSAPDHGGPPLGEELGRVMLLDVAHRLRIDLAGQSWACRLVVQALK